MSFAQIIFTVVFCSFLDIQSCRRHLSMHAIIFPACYRKATSMVDIHKTQTFSNYKVAFAEKAFTGEVEKNVSRWAFVPEELPLGSISQLQQHLRCLDYNSQNSPASKLNLQRFRNTALGDMCNTKALKKKPHISFHFEHVSPIFMLLGVILVSLFLDDLNYSRMSF